MTPNVTIMYRPTGRAELALVRATGFTRWPPRLPGQPIFYPVTNEAYATQIARDWNVPERGYGCVTRFAVRRSFADRYPIQIVGSSQHAEWWIPAEELEALNDAIVGVIEIAAEFGDLGPSDIATDIPRKDG